MWGEVGRPGGVVKVRHLGKEVGQMGGGCQGKGLGERGKIAGWGLSRCGTWGERYHGRVGVVKMWNLGREV